MKLEFKQYYESKLKLLEAADSSPKVKVRYKLIKYCKLPFYETVSSSERKYITLKPDDIVEILWERDTPDTSTVRCICIVETHETLFPSWGSSKMLSWTINNTEEIQNLS